MKDMWSFLETLDELEQSKKPVLIIDKGGDYKRGRIKEHYVRISAGKLRGKIILVKKENKAEEEIDANDVLDIEEEKNV